MNLSNDYMGPYCCYYSYYPRLRQDRNNPHFCIACSLTVEATRKMQKASKCLSRILGCPTVLILTFINEKNV